jgi:hypothetical protein
MKIILRIITILLVAAVVAGTLTLIVNNTASATSGPGGEGGQPPSMNSTNGQMPARPEGGPNGDREGGASIGQGLLQVLVTLAKVAGITVVVLLIEKGVSLLKKNAPKAAQSSPEPLN